MFAICYSICVFKINDKLCFIGSYSALSQVDENAVTYTGTDDNVLGAT